jgi:hypothetical protein
VTATVASDNNDQLTISVVAKLALDGVHKAMGSLMIRTPRGFMFGDFRLMTIGRHFLNPTTGPDRMPWQKTILENYRGRSRSKNCD